MSNPSVNEERILRFPEQASVGGLYYTTVLEGERAWADWQYFSKAQGVVRVPMGVLVKLGWWKSDAYACLQELAPDDLFALAFYYDDISDGDLLSLHRLTGLHELSLQGTAITDAGLVHFAGLLALEHLNLNSTKITGTGLRSFAMWIEFEQGLQQVQNAHSFTMDGREIPTDWVEIGDASAEIEGQGAYQVTFPTPHGFYDDSSYWLQDTSAS